MELLFIHYMYGGFKIYLPRFTVVKTFIHTCKLIGQQMLNKAYKIVAVSYALKEKIKAKYHYEKLL
jgi:N-acetylgalactosamine-N,N'-diacetylbacillosaminyl-diphospho-undecaprenol 4-alpha-N-acetylgalactosaminyltransferase